jgi:hypothetical protein
LEDFNRELYEKIRLMPLEEVQDLKNKMETEFKQLENDLRIVRSVYSWKSSSNDDSNDEE